MNTNVTTIITVYDDGDTNPIINTHGIFTDDEQADKVMEALRLKAVDEGWNLANNSHIYQQNYTKGGPRRTLTIKKESTSFRIDLNLTK